MMVFAKKTVAAVLAISSASCFHNLSLNLAAGLLVPGRTVVGSLVSDIFFLAIVVGGALGAAKLWNRWILVFGVWVLITALGTVQMINQVGGDLPPPTAADKLAAYVAATFVSVTAVILLIREFLRLRASRGGAGGLMVTLLGSADDVDLDAARRAFLRQDSSRAAEICTKIIEKHPDHALAHLLRGASCRAAGIELERSLSDISRYIELMPPDSHGAVAGYAERGSVYGALKNYPASLADLSRAIEMGLDDPMVYSNRGVTHMHMKNHAAALEDFNQAIERNPKEALAHNGRGGVHVEMKNYPAAQADLQKALDLLPDYPLALLNMGMLRIGEGKLEEGYGWLRRSFKLDARCLDHVRTDEDLDFLRGTPEFQALMAEFEKPAAAPPTTCGT